MAGLIRKQEPLGFYCKPSLSTAKDPSPPPSPPPPPPPQKALPKKRSRSFSGVDDRKEMERCAMWWMQEYDPDQQITGRDVDDIVRELLRSVDDTLASGTGADVDENWIQREVRILVQRTIERKEKEAVRNLRFGKKAHVLCNLGDQWSSGTVQAVNVIDPQARWLKLPYVVHLDPPISALISAPSDSNDTIRPEVCFGQSSDSLRVTLMCLPQVHKSIPRRFQVGDRVACLIEDCPEDPTGTVWAAGTIEEVDVSMEAAAKEELPHAWTSQWPLGVPAAPYRARLDNECSVLVHKDEHWLVRDLAHQPEGLCQGADGTRCVVDRIEKRQYDGAWVVVDHMTRKVRPCDPPDAQDSDELRCLECEKS